MRGVGLPDIAFHRIPCQQHLGQIVQRPADYIDHSVWNTLPQHSPSCKWKFELFLEGFYRTGTLTGVDYVQKGVSRSASSELCFFDRKGAATRQRRSRKAI